jgi:outer membrane murein-binding lipoprotein Lpp
MKKQIPAIIASLLITLVIGLGMFFMGGDAVLNPNGVPVQNSPGAVSTADPSTTAQAQVQQLQSLVTQYQQREQQYQSELSAAQTQLNQASTTIQQYQRLLQALQSRGLITIDNSGKVFLPGG